jgi:integrase
MAKGIEKRVGKSGVSYRAVASVDGEKRQQTFHTEEEAKLWLLHQQQAKIRGDVVRMPSKETLASVIDRYVKDDGKWEHDKASHLARLRKELGHVKLSDLTTQRIVDYIIDLKFAPSNAQSRLSYLGSVLLQAKVVYGLTVRDHELQEARQRLAKKKIIGQSTARIRRPEEGEVDAIAAAHQDTDQSCDLREILEILEVLPIRVGELCRIKWTDIDHAKRQVVLRQRKHPDRQIKMGQNEKIPLPKINGKDTYDLIVTNRKKFDNQDGPFPYVVKAISNAMALARTKARLNNDDPLHIHDLRAHAICSMIEAGIGDTHIRKISGHKNLQVFHKHYASRIKLEDVCKQIEAKMAA